MIQRIQTIWLLLVAICAFLSLQFSFYNGSITENNMTSFKELKGTDSILLIIVTATIGLLAGYCIFLYKKRSLQIILCVTGILLEALLIFLYYNEVNKYSSGTYSLTALLHMCIVLFFFLAAKGINNDRKIIKDSNRLR